MIEAMKMALEALEAAKNNHGVMLLSDPPQEAWRFYQVSERCSIAITALRQAIEQAEQQEGTVMAEYKFQTYAAYKKDGETKIGVVPEPEQEPVAWRDMAYANLGAVRDKMPPEQVTAVQDWLEKVYTIPPQRQFVGLTDEERRDIREWQEIQKELGPVWAPMMLYLYVAIEAKLKEKNT